MAEVRLLLLLLAVEVVAHEKVSSKSNAVVALDRVRAGERSLGTHLSRKTLVEK